MGKTRRNDWWFKIKNINYSYPKNTHKDKDVQTQRFYECSFKSSLKAINNNNNNNNEGGPFWLHCYKRWSRYLAPK
jgi:hypothetical protein